MAFSEYATALLTHYGQWVQPARRQAKGPAPSRAGCRCRAALCTGDQDDAAATPGRGHTPRGLRHAGGHQAGAGRCGWQINTAFVERAQPHHPSACGRGGAAGQHAVQGRGGLAAAVGAVSRLRQLLPPPRQLTPAAAEPEPTNGTASAQLWRPHTPAMAAGLTDHVWTLREVLLVTACRRGPSRRWGKEWERRRIVRSGKSGVLVIRSTGRQEV